MREWQMSKKVAVLSLLLSMCSGFYAAAETGSRPRPQDGGYNQLLSVQAGLFQPRGDDRHYIEELGLRARNSFTLDLYFMRRIFSTSSHSSFNLVGRLGSVVSIYENPAIALSADEREVFTSKHEMLVGFDSSFRFTKFFEIFARAMLGAGYAGPTTFYTVNSSGVTEAVASDGVVIPIYSIGAGFRINIFEQFGFLFSYDYVDALSPFQVKYTDLSSDHVDAVDMPYGRHHFSAGVFFRW
jgi:hypothetical protein